MEHQGFLARVPIFSGCSLEEIAAIDAVAVEQAFQTGQVIVSQGTQGNALYILLEGRVELMREGKSLGAFRAGDFFGEMSLLDSAPRSHVGRRTENLREQQV